MKRPRVASRPDASSRERMPNRYGTTNDQVIAVPTLAMKYTGARPLQKKPQVPASESNIATSSGRVRPKRVPITITRPAPAAPIHVAQPSAWPMKSRSSAKRSEEHTSELQSLMRISYAVFCLKKNTAKPNKNNKTLEHNKQKHN